MIEAILWDNDGVLVDSESLFFEMTRSFFAEAGLLLDAEYWGVEYLGNAKHSYQIAGVFFSGSTFAIYPSSTVTTKFTQTDGANFETLGVNAYIGGQPGILTVASVDYGVVRRDEDSPSDSLLVDSSATVNAGPLPWAVRAGDTTDTFYDYVNAPFLSYQAGDILVYKQNTVDEVRVSITEVIGASEVRVSGALPQGKTSVSYAVISTYKTGLQLLVAGRRHDIVDVRDIHTLEVSPPALADGR